MKGRSLLWFRYFGFLLVIGCAFGLTDKAARPLSKVTAQAVALQAMTALAVGDFDEDGTPDLACGGALNDGGAVHLQLGNPSAVYPHSPVAQQLRSRGEVASTPFLPTSIIFPLPGAPDFLAAGDFDADGHYDLAAAMRAEAALYWLRGDGHGNFEKAQQLALPGNITTWRAGEVNRADGLADLVIGVQTAQGARLLVFEGPNGALQSAPEVFSLPAVAADIALGDLDGDAMFDLAVATGERLWLAKGRDRRLSHNQLSRQSVPPPLLLERRFPVALRALASGT
jgi:hypothetical protein